MKPLEIINVVKVLLCYKYVSETLSPDFNQKIYFDFFMRLLQTYHVNLGERARMFQFKDRYKIGRRFHDGRGKTALTNLLYPSPLGPRSCGGHNYSMSYISTSSWRGENLRDRNWNFILKNLNTIKMTRRVSKTI